MPVPASTGATAAGQRARARSGDPLRGRRARCWRGAGHAADCVRARMSRREQPASRLRHRRGDPRAAARVGRRRLHPEPLVIATSGSTGAPKRVVLSRDAMRASALATQERLGGPGQWVLNLPPTYVAGVQVLYRSVVAGHRAGCRRRGRRRGALLRLAGADPAHPAACATRRAERAGRLRRGAGRWRSARPAVRARGASAGGISVVQTYGMSETCGGCVYDGVPLDGVEVADRRRRRGAAARADALRRLRGRARPDRGGDAGRLVPHRRPRRDRTRTAGCG